MREFWDYIVELITSLISLNSDKHNFKQKAQAAKSKKLAEEIAVAESQTHQLLQALAIRNQELERIDREQEQEMERLLLKSAREKPDENPLALEDRAIQSMPVKQLNDQKIMLAASVTISCQQRTKTPWEITREVDRSHTEAEGVLAQNHFLQKQVMKALADAKKVEKGTKKQLEEKRYVHNIAPK